ncbi:MAG: TM1266 family iron-only hydrogenase system putative regulator [Tractidigestivibacter sp.]|jgi:putative iron-only hydrogenase system regulator|uniref:TM1266 family iron-only hydrogenase system putative regulator n=1 Tax=Tractidigestivibacter sp. TaxID=2847320 RepID=UPI003D942B4C
MSETRVAVMAIIVERPESVAQLNSTLHGYAQYVIGRMGIPYPKRHVNIISVAIDAPQDKIAALAGRIGAIEGVSVKTAYSNVISES